MYYCFKPTKETLRKYVYNTLFVFLTLFRLENFNIFLKISIDKNSQIGWKYHQNYTL